MSYEGAHLHDMFENTLTVHYYMAPDKNPASDRMMIKKKKNITPCKHIIPLRNQLVKDSRLFQAQLYVVILDRELIVFHSQLETIIE